MPSTGRQSRDAIDPRSRGANQSRRWGGALSSAAGWAGGVHTGYRHECLLYDGVDDILATVLPFIRDGLERRQPVLVAVTGTRLDALRSALGADQELVMFAEMAELGGNPARIIPAWREFTDRYGAHRQPVRGVGEPIWAGRSDPEIAECQLHEALLNMAVLPDTPLWLICPYDIRTLDGAVITEAYLSHPHLARTKTVHGRAGAVGDNVRQIGSGYGGTTHVDDLFEAALPEPRSAHTSMEFIPDRRSDSPPAETRPIRNAGPARSGRRAMLPTTVPSPLGLTGPPVRGCVVVLKHQPVGNAAAALRGRRVVERPHRPGHPPGSPPVRFPILDYPRNRLHRTSSVDDGTPRALVEFGQRHPPVRYRRSPRAVARIIRRTPGPISSERR